MTRDKTELALVDLGRPGKDHVRAELAEGHQLAAALAAVVETRPGAAYAYLPSGLPRLRVEQLDVGGLGESESIRKERDRLTVEQIMSAAERAGPGCVLVLEERDARTTDPDVSEWDDPFFVVGDHIYYFCSLHDPDADLIARMFKLALSYPTVAAVMSCIRVPRNREVLSPSDLAAMADRPELVIVGGYDLEAEIFWSPVREGVTT